MTTEAIITEVLELAVAEIKTASRLAGQVATGKTLASLEVRSKPNGGEVLANNYIGVLEAGRKGGKVPINFQDIILQWAKAKGLTFSTPAAARRFAYFTAKKIAKEGTKLYRAGGRKDILTPAVDLATRRLSDRLANAMEVKIKNLIFKI